MNGSEKARRGLGTRVLRGALVLAACLLVLAALGFARLAWHASEDPAPGFAERQGKLSAATFQGREVRGEHVREDYRLESSSGLAVELAVLRPASDSEPASIERRPLAVLLGGHRTGRDAVDLVTEPGGTVLAALSYPYEGDHRAKGLRLLAAAPAIQDALVDTPPAVLLALDFLLEQPFVDPERVELVGVSLGALAATAAGAIDPRFRRVWVMHGAGDLPELLTHALKRELSHEGTRDVLGRFLAWITHAEHLSPERWVPRIAPREVVFVNARADEKMPIECIEALHASAEDPHRVIWLPGGHVEKDRPEIVRELVSLVLADIHER